MSTNYNERAWAADVISEINRLVERGDGHIRRAGGEYTVTGEFTALYPDVLLFRDPTAAVILQGWELKMPDTSIDDAALLENAKEKAIRLGLDSFLVWNVARAKLYQIGGGPDPVGVAEWNDLADIQRREDVKPAEARWKTLLGRIIDELNDRFARGDLRGRPFIEAYQSQGLVAFVNSNRGAVAEAIRDNRARDGLADAQLIDWWRIAREEFGGSVPEDVLARIVLINWLSKFLFAHLLTPRFDVAKRVGEIANGTSVDRAIEIFTEISRSCNFWTIFAPHLGQTMIPPSTWSDLLQFNQLLGDLRLGAVSQEQLGQLLEHTVAASRRELRGQFTTPPALAQLIVRLALDDKQGVLGDLCCGTGTIPRAALDIKREYEVSDAQASRTVWASDWSAEPLQLASIAVALPRQMGEVIQVFLHDAFGLSVGQVIEFQDPNTGAPARRALPTFDAIATNLPFVGQKGRSLYRDQIRAVDAWLRQKLGRNHDLPGRSDIAAYLPFAMWRLLRVGGRLAIIITNAWLGTQWGDKFRERLLQFFKLHAVVASGCHRWFRNSDVITNVLLLEKREPTQTPPADEQTRFVLIQRPIEDWADRQSNADLAAAIHLGRPIADVAQVRVVTTNSLNRAAELGLAGSAQFVDWTWALDLPVVRIADRFTLIRGARRGWDKMFYPRGAHSIEPEYLTPVLKTLASVKKYVAETDGHAFTCGESLDVLERRGHRGAMAWIRKFETGANDVGKPLPESLAIPGRHWYEMRPDATADLVAGINPGDRLFIPRLRSRSFVNQRLVGLRSDEADLDLCHALLNSVVAMFWLEGMGFGRGLGALDLSKDQFENRMMMLDPTRLDQPKRDAIVQAFTPLLDRAVLPLPDELQAVDRREFDQAVLDCFGMGAIHDRIRMGLLDLFTNRKSAAEE